MSKREYIFQGAICPRAARLCQRGMISSWNQAGIFKGRSQPSRILLPWNFWMHCITRAINWYSKHLLLSLLRKTLILIMSSKVTVLSQCSLYSIWLYWREWLGEQLMAIQLKSWRTMVGMTKLLISNLARPQRGCIGKQPFIHSLINKDLLKAYCLFLLTPVSGSGFSLNVTSLGKPLTSEPRLGPHVGLFWGTSYFPFHRTLWLIPAQF